MMEKEHMIKPEQDLDSKVEKTTLTAAL